MAWEAGEETPDGEMLLEPTAGAEAAEGWGQGGLCAGGSRAWVGG